MRPLRYSINVTPAWTERSRARSTPRRSTPRIVGHGPSLFAGLSRTPDSKLIDRVELDTGAVAVRYEPRK